MKTFLIFGLVAVTLVSTAFAGPITGGGPQYNPLQESKKKLTAVMDVLGSVPDRIVKIEQTGGMEYTVTLDHYSCGSRTEKYVLNIDVQPGGEAAYTAKFLSRQGHDPDCN